MGLQPGHVQKYIDRFNISYVVDLNRNATLYGDVIKLWLKRGQIDSRVVEWGKVVSS